MTTAAGEVDTRVFLIHAGEETTARVRRALEAAHGRDRTWTLHEVADVSPMDAAFNAMLTRADLSLHVQVDADMELRPHAIETLRAAIRAADADVWQISFPLWDTLFHRPIQGIKIYRSEIARRFPYRGVRHCEMDQIERAAEAGLRIESRSSATASLDDVLGLHLVPDERTAFWNCFDRAMRWKWLDGSGRTSNWMAWILPYFQLFFERYVTERDPRLLYGWAGLIAGVSQPIPSDWGEKDIRRPPEAFERIRAILSMTEEDWRGAGLPKRDQASLPELARQVARATGRRGWRPAWAVSPFRPRGAAGARASASRLARWLRRRLHPKRGGLRSW